jgi:phage terminase large subunit-like protein
VIYTLDRDEKEDGEATGDDWTDPKCWIKANPNLGVSVYEDDLHRLSAKAQTMTTAQNNFLTKRMNIWVHADTAWMNMQSWAKCGGQTSIEALPVDVLCWMGLDLASKIDLAALTLLFRDLEGHYWRFGRYYLPEAVVEEGQHPHADHYAAWAKAGLLTLTPGNVIDLDLIEADIYELGSTHNVISVGYDPWQSTQLAIHLTERGVPMVEVIPGVRSFSEPMKAMEGLVAEGKWNHGDDPVLRWMVSNVVAHLDRKDNIYPRKERQHDKIDGVIADLMALSRALVETPVPGSVYEERGVLFV